MSSVATDADRRALANAEAGSEDAERLRELQSLRAQVRDLTHQCQNAWAAYGNCQNDLAAARGQRQPEVAALADGLIRAIGMDGAEALHRELGDVLMTRLVSGAHP